jgi:hypothetical protein
MTVEEWKRKNPPIQRKPITNYDRLTAMSVEELAGELLDLFAAFYAVEWSKEVLLDWLKQEIKDGD